MIASGRIRRIDRYLAYPAACDHAYPAFPPIPKRLIINELQNKNNVKTIVYLY